MLSSLLTQLTSLQAFFSRAFLIAALLPTLLFLFLNAVIFYLWSWPVHDWVRSQLLDATVSVLDKTILFAGFFFALWIASYITAALTPLWIRTLEGRNWWSWLSKGGATYHLNRYRDLSLQIEKAVRIHVDIDRNRKKWDQKIQNAFTGAGPGKSGAASTTNTQNLIKGLQGDSAIHKLIEFKDLESLVDTYDQELRTLGATDTLKRLASDITLLIDYASIRAKGEYSGCLNERNLNFGEVAKIAPTKFGNIGLSAQAYATRAYGCNLALIWSSLRHAAEKTENIAKELENCKSRLDFLVACFWLTLLLAVEWALLFAFNGDVLPALIIAFAGPLICWMLWYGAAVEQYRSLQDLIISLLNHLRFQVLSDLRLGLPIDLNEERELWRVIELGIGSGEPFNLRYQHPSP